MTKALLLSEGDHWNTPPEILSLVCRVAPIGLDPCSNSGSLVGAALAYDLERGEDGLLLPWAGLGLVFCNPPYSRGNIDRFAHRIAREAKAGVEIVVLVNASTETKWWALLANISPVYCYLRGRLRFLRGGKPGGAARLPSVLLYFGPSRKKFARVFSSVGDIQEKSSLCHSKEASYCDICKEPLVSLRSTRKTCSARCRKTMQRQQQKENHVRDTTCEIDLGRPGLSLQRPLEGVA